jgi:hypothetical protein
VKTKDQAGKMRKDTKNFASDRWRLVQFAGDSDQQREFFGFKFFAA